MERYFEVLYGPLTVGFLDGFRHRFHRALGCRVAAAVGESLGTKSLWK